MVDYKPLSVFGPLRENMTSFTKQEVHNVLHCHHSRTEPWPQITCKETFVKFGHLVFRYASGQTDRSTDRHDDCNTSCPPRSESITDNGMIKTLITIPTIKNNDDSQVSCNNINNKFLKAAYKKYFEQLYA